MWPRAMRWRARRWSRGTRGSRCRRRKPSSGGWSRHKAAAKVEVPFDYDPRRHQSIQRYFLRLDPPDSGRPDRRLGARDAGAGRPRALHGPQASLDVLRCMPSILRGEDCPALPESPETSIWDEGPLPWEVTAVVALDSWDRPDGPPQLLALLPGDQTDRNFGAAVDIGTTTVTVWLVDLETGEVVAQAADYNGQIARGEDVISRIIYAKRDDRLAEMQEMVVGTINRLLEAACKQVGASTDGDLQADGRRQHHHDAPAAGDPARQHPPGAVHPGGQPRADADRRRAGPGRASAGARGLPAGRGQLCRRGHQRGRARAPRWTRRPS